VYVDIVLNHKGGGQNVLCCDTYPYSPLATTSHEATHTVIRLPFFQFSQFILPFYFQPHVLLKMARNFYGLYKILTMAKTSRGRSQDRSKVAGGQDYELEYEKQKTGSSKKQIKSAIKAVGNQRQQVEKKLQKSK